MSRRTTLTAALLALLVSRPSAAQTPEGYEAPFLQAGVELVYPAALKSLPEPPAGRIELKYVCLLYTSPSPRD